MVDLSLVEKQAPSLDVGQLRKHGLIVIYDEAAGRPGGADVRQIVNVIVASHPLGPELFQLDLTDEPAGEGANDIGNGMTFLVDIPRVRLIPNTSREVALALEGAEGAVIDLRKHT